MYCDITNIAILLVTTVTAGSFQKRNVERALNAAMCISFFIPFFGCKQMPRLWNMKSWLCSNSKCSVTSPNTAILLVTTVTAGRSMEAKTNKKLLMVAQCSWLHKGNSIDSLLAVEWFIMYWTAEQKWQNGPECSRTNFRFLCVFIWTYFCLARQSISACAPSMYFRMVNCARSCKRTAKIFN